MARDFRCAGFPTAPDHPPRSAEPGFQNVVITRADLPPGTLIPDPGGTLCGACQAANRLAQATNGNVKRALITSIRGKFRTSPVSQFTIPETQLLINRIFSDEDSD